MWLFTSEGVTEALRLFQRARELDPTFPAAYAHEAYTHYINLMVGYSENPEESASAGFALAKKAVALDDMDPVAYFALGRIYMVQGKHDASIAELEMSIRLNPSFSQAHHGLGFALALAGRLEEAVEALAMAIRLSPRDPLNWATTVVHSMTCTLMHDYEEGVEWAHETIRLPRAKGYWPQAALAAALGNLGRLDEARDAVASALKEKPDVSLSYLAKTLPTKHPGGLAPYLDGLRKAGLPE